MKPTPKTLGLFALLLVLLALNFVDQGTGQRLADTLPHLSAMNRAEIQRIELSSAAEKVVFERVVEEGSPVSAITGEAGRWRITAPIDADADQVAVRSLLNSFRKDVPIDIKLEEGSHDTYGLDATNGIVAEFWTGEGEPAVSFTIGWDAPGGSSFVRLSGDEGVYRARVGGRHRYQKRAGEWRNKVLLDVDPKQVVGLSVQSQGKEHVLSRSPVAELEGAGDGGLGPWTMTPDPGWPVDQLAVTAMVKGLSSMRAGEVLGGGFDGGFSPPLASAEIALASGRTRRLELGTRTVEGGAFVRVDGAADVYRTAKGAAGAILIDAEYFRDKTLYAFNRKNIDTLTLALGGVTVILQQDLSNSFWTVIQPANVDIDMKNVFFAVNTLSSLRADAPAGVTAEAAGLLTPSARIVARFLDGQTAVLEVGGTTQTANGGAAHFVRKAGEDAVWVLRDEQVQKLYRGFGR